MIRDLYITNYTTTCFDMVNSRVHTCLIFNFQNKGRKESGRTRKTSWFLLYKVSRCKIIWSFYRVVPGRVFGKTITPAKEHPIGWYFIYLINKAWGPYWEKINPILEGTDRGQRASFIFKKRSRTDILALG